MFKDAVTFNGMTFGQVVAEVLAIQVGEQAGYDDVDLFGAPRECYALVHQGAVRELEALLERAGLTVEEYDQELDARVSGTWAHFSGAGIDPWDVRSELRGMVH